MQLTARQWQVVELVTEGMKNAEIARALGTTEHVVKNYLRVIFDRTGMWTRLELALWYLKVGEKEQYKCGRTS